MMTSKLALRCPSLSHGLSRVSTSVRSAAKPPAPLAVATTITTKRFRSYEHPNHYHGMESERMEETRQMERNFTREWQVGDVYAPHDLSAAEARKWKVKKAPTTDAFDVLNINPIDVYKNFSIMSEYVTEMGRIRPRAQTGLRLVNQRRVAKAIRRAIALGLMPSVYKHPEILKREEAARGPM